MHSIGVCLFCGVPSQRPSGHAALQFLSVRCRWHCALLGVSGSALKAAE